MTDRQNNEPKTEKPSKLTLAVRIIAAIVILLALLFGPAGTFNWPEAWVFLAIYFGGVTGLSLWLRKHDPELLKERAFEGTKKNVKDWDQKIMLAFTILLLLMLALAGIDAVRFGWSKMPLWVKILGFSGFIPSAVILYQVMKHNSYLSERVRIQEERGHKVCTTGPYKYVRHPMYVGIILSIFCLPLALGSFYALIPAVPIVFLFVLRTALEDKTLQAELPGYKEYAQKVRYRLIPKIY